MTRRACSRRPATLMAATVAVALLAGCRGFALGAPSGASVTVEAPPAESGWRMVASPADTTLIDGLDAAWRTAFAAGRGAGAVTDPTAALPRAALPPGPYHCRLHRVGPAPARRGRPAAGRGPFACSAVLQGDLLAFTLQGGPRRPGGFVYAESDRRMIFIGAEATGREPIVPAYGAQTDRDIVGVVERIGPFRYRLVLAPRDAGGAINVLELSPAL